MNTLKFANKSNLRLLLYLNLSILYCISNHNFIQAQTNKSNMENVFAIEKVVELMLDTNYIVSTKKIKGGIEWNTSSTPWNQVLFISSDTSSTEVDLICTLSDTVARVVLTRKEKGSHYQLFKAGPGLFNDWWLESTSGNNNGIINNVCLWKNREEKVVVGNLSGGRTPEYIAKNISDNLVSFAFFSDSSLNNFGLNVLYDKSLNSIVATSDYSLSNEEYSSTFIRASNNEWMEYVYNNNQITAIAVHDTVPGLMKKCMLDINEDGIPDINFGLSASGDSLLIYSREEFDLNDLEPEMLTTLFVEANNSLGRHWEEIRDVLKSSNALGYRLPRIQKLP